MRNRYKIFGSTAMLYVILALGVIWFLIVMYVWINFLFFAPGGDDGMYKIPGL